MKREELIDVLRAGLAGERGQAKAAAMLEADARLAERLLAIAACNLYMNWSEDNYAAGWYHIPDQAFANKAMAEALEDATGNAVDEQDGLAIEGLRAALGAGEGKP